MRVEGFSALDCLPSTEELNPFTLNNLLGRDWVQSDHTTHYKPFISYGFLN